MKTRFAALLLAGVSLAPVAALADTDSSHLLDVGYATATRSAVPNDVWSVGLDSLFSYDHLNLQLGGDYMHVSPDVKTGAFDLYNGEGNIFWRDHVGEFGVSGGYGTVNPSGVKNSHVASYGAFGEWYLLYNTTLRIKGGAFDGQIEGWYAGTGLEFYIARDLGFNVEYNYTQGGAGHVHDFDADLEYLISHDYPLSISAGYERANTKTAESNAILVRLRYRFGAEGSLATIDRSGPTQWDGVIPLSNLH
ncbi:MAG TPA: hypothetical protein VGG10_13265 [Rhizomicrobium sp.]|jgi:opacity protein-like surface antigen